MVLLALRLMLLPGILAITTPVIIGFGFGADGAEDGARDDDLEGEQDEADDKKQENCIHDQAFSTMIPNSVCAVTTTDEPFSAEPMASLAS